MNKITIFFTIFMASNVFANPVILDNKAQVSKAKELHEAIGVLSNKVTECVDKDNKSIEECGCYSLETCQFKSDYKLVVNLYCKIKADFPEWSSKTVNYQDQNSGENIALGMVGLEKMFGKQCK